MFWKGPFLFRYDEEDMNETVLDTEEVMAVIEVVMFMSLSQSMCLRNTKNDHTNEERN